MSATVFSSLRASASMAPSVASSLSDRAISNSSLASRRPVSSSFSVVTTPSRIFRSRPSSCARFGSFQSAGSSSLAAISARRRSLSSKSKIPPQFDAAGFDVGEALRRGVDTFSFHVPLPENH